VAAALLPVLSIVVLYVVNSDGLKLGIIVLFSAVFALVLALMTNARRIEIFAATAASVFFKSLELLARVMTLKRGSLGSLPSTWFSWLTTDMAEKDGLPSGINGLDVQA
jgi:hypothetical protein